ncbi:hypothetical protein ACFWR9_11430 [Streptomyces sp. NPDC058534]|uniref:hypothetical protein n=1 Tax=Streptomyces sp. NPDC058534 TaxID=3346541 RepID=UPI00364EEF5C
MATGPDHYAGEKSSRAADATPQPDDALTLECSTTACRRRAPLSEARETWSRPVGEHGWLCPDCAARRPYREVWDPTLPPGGYVCSTCGEPVESEPCPDHAHPARATEPPSRATNDTPGEGT